MYHISMGNFLEKYKDIRVIQSLIGTKQIKVILNTTKITQYLSVIIFTNVCLHCFRSLRYKQFKNNPLPFHGLHSHSGGKEICNRHDTNKYVLYMI